MPGSGTTTAATTLALAGVQASKVRKEDGDILYLSLGALMGICYVLGTEKYLRVIQHRHLYVRLSVLLLAPYIWLHSVFGLSVICLSIFHRTPDRVEGFERVLGVLVPAVVRADIIIDWAHRLSWALVSCRSWTGGMVQFQRVVARAPTLHCLTLSDESGKLVDAVLKAPADFAQAESTIWSEDAADLVRDVRKHFPKLASVIFHGALEILRAYVAAGMGGLHLAQQGSWFGAVSFAVLVLLSPLPALIVLVGSSGVVVVVTLSFVGTLIRLYMYELIRIFLR